MAGKIKSGQGTLIGNAGEYYVVAELLKRRYVAALTPRNAPDFDILATNGDKTVKIRVKTKSEQYDIWQWNAKKDGAIFRNITDLQDFTVLVDLTLDHKDMDFFILPTPMLNDWLVEDFEQWLATPGRGGRPHSPTNKKRHLHYTRFEEKLQGYQNNWETLWE